MKNVEQFIQEHTKNTYNYNSYAPSPTPWLTPEHARCVAQIAREETIKEVCEWLKKNVTYIHPRKETEECVVNIARLKEDLGL